MADAQLSTPQNRAPREVTRERPARPVSWRPPEALPMPDDRPGWAHRWVRVSMMGDADPKNISEKLREGWEPCKAADYPELKFHEASGTRFPGSVEIGGLLLCRIPSEFMEQRDAYYRGQADREIEAVDNDFMRVNDPRMPVFRDRKTEVSFGNGS